MALHLFFFLRYFSFFWLFHFLFYEESMSRLVSWYMGKE